MRARNIKPGFYKNEELAECSYPARLLFPGLWMMADRAGRMEYRPKRIKAELFPFDTEDVVQLLDELEHRDLIRRYEVGGQQLIWIPGFRRHQNPHVNERASDLPAHPEDPDFVRVQERHSTSTGVAPEQHDASTVQAPEPHNANTGALGLIPSLLNPSSLNLESKKTEEALAPSERVKLQREQPKAPPPAAAFEFELSEGEIVRLLERDVVKWEGAYLYIDVRAELQAISDKPAEVRAKWTKKTWFGTLSAWLKAANARAKQANPTFDPTDPDGAKRHAQERKEQEAEFKRQGIAPPTKIYTSEDYLNGRVPGCLGFGEDCPSTQASSPVAVVELVASRVALDTSEDGTLVSRLGGGPGYTRS
jgi:hypothetical protein